jgi:hypothetical protein
MGEKSLLTLDRRAAYHSPCILGISGCLVLRGKGRHRSMRWRAVRVDQFPVEATVALVDDLEVGYYGRVIALDQRAFPLFPARLRLFNLLTAAFVARTLTTHLSAGAKDGGYDRGEGPPSSSWGERR